MSQNPDTVDVLTADHDTIRRLFDAFKLMGEQAACDSERGAMVTRICQAFGIHIQLESELFYPAVRAATEEAALMDRADAAQLATKELIAELMAMNPHDAGYDGKVTELSTALARHAQQQEGEVFPLARAAGVDLVALRAHLEERQHELRDQQPKVQDSPAQAG